MRVVLLIILILSCNILYAQYFRKIKYSKERINVLSRENIVADIDAYENVIKRKHVQPFSEISRVDFHNKLQQLKDSAYKYNIDELMVKWLQVNALLQDEHTLIHFFQRDLLPLGCYWFSEGIYVISTDDDHKWALYTRIIAVNNMPVADVTEKIRSLVANNNIPSLKAGLYSFLFDPVILHGLGITSRRDSVPFTLVREKEDEASGNISYDTFTIAFSPVDARKLKKIDYKCFLRYSQPEIFWYKYESEGNYLYFKYASCYDDKKHPFKKFKEELFKEIEEKKPAKIIIDMRDNRGGYPVLFRPVLNDLARSDLNKKNKIFVLIGRKTFSAAIINTTGLKERTYAQVIGERTSGSTFFYGGVKYEILPATKLMMQYSTNFWAANEKNEGSLIPDIEIPETFKDFFICKDAALEYAISK